jgi:hypothetical protein
MVLAGNKAKAESWKDADRDLPILEEARREIRQVGVTDGALNPARKSGTRQPGASAPAILSLCAA